MITYLYGNCTMLNHFVFNINANLVLLKHNLLNKSITFLIKFLNDNLALWTSVQSLINLILTLQSINFDLLKYHLLN